MNRSQQIRRIIRLVWIAGGLTFLTWIILSYQSRGIDPAVFADSATVTIEHASNMDVFTPVTAPKRVGLIFYPGAMVDPKAYFPLLKEIAVQGFPVYLIHLPYRLAPFSAQVDELFQTTLATIEQDSNVSTWVIGGHSKGGALAAQFAHANPQAVAGLALIATTHPKDAQFDLANFEQPTIKIYATHDGLATPEEIQEYSHFLPAATEYVAIEGGNHSQFGYYGKQLGDDNATISRSQQQQQTLDALIEFLGMIEPGTSQNIDACIAAHYLARHADTLERILHWNQEALRYADAAAKNPGGSAEVAAFYPSLYLNLSKSYEDLDDPVTARHYYQLAAEKASLLAGEYGDIVRRGIASGLQRTDSK